MSNEHYFISDQQELLDWIESVDSKGLQKLDGFWTEDFDKIVKQKIRLKKLKKIKDYEKRRKN